MNATYEQSSNALCREEIVKLDSEHNFVNDDKDASIPSIFLSPAMTASAISLKNESLVKEVDDEEMGVQSSINSSVTRDQVEVVVEKK